MCCHHSFSMIFDQEFDYRIQGVPKVTERQTLIKNINQKQQI